MPTTSNFGWTTPADTDLVKDGAAAIRTLGNGIDTSLVDLKGGTTGQILSKASNTDLDYTWIANDQGDITEVSAGTGISVASGTGPIPVVTNTVATTFDAKGDLVVGTGADTFAKLAVGTNGYTLVADSSVSPTGLKWAAPAGGGKILQVVQGNTSTATTSTSNTYIDTNLSASITPAATSSKVLVIVSLMGIQTAANNTGISPKLVRGATDIVDYFAMPQIPENGSGHGAEYSWNFSYLDSPSTTSSTTYKIQFKSYNGATVKVQNNSVNSYIQLLEVGA